MKTDTYSEARGSRAARTLAALSIAILFWLPARASGAGPVLFQEYGANGSYSPFGVVGGIAAGSLLGGLIGAASGIGLALSLDTLALNQDLGGYSIALGLFGGYYVGSGIAAPFAAWGAGSLMQGGGRLGPTLLWAEIPFVVGTGLIIAGGGLALEIFPSNSQQVKDLGGDLVPVGAVIGGLGPLIGSYVGYATSRADPDAGYGWLDKHLAPPAVALRIRRSSASRFSPELSARLISLRF